MKKSLCVILFVCLSLPVVTAQKYFSKTGLVHFLSEASLEQITATNNNAYVVLDVKTGQLEWSVLIKGFRFEKALMQQHFNENYMESDKYPKAVFKGSLLNCERIDFSKDGTYDVHVDGNMTIHGVSKPLRAPGELIIKNGAVHAEGTFDLTIADFNITVPKVVRDNIAKTVRVTVKTGLQPLK